MSRVKSIRLVEREANPGSDRILVATRGETGKVTLDLSYRDGEYLDGQTAMSVLLSDRQRDRLARFLRS